MIGPTYKLATYEKMEAALREFAKALQNKTYVSNEIDAECQETKVEVGSRLEELINSYLGEE
jgi:hypothetical protein